MIYRFERVSSGNVDFNDETDPYCMIINRQNRNIRYPEISSRNKIGSVADNHGPKASVGKHSRKEKKIQKRLLHDLTIYESLSISLED